VTAYHLLRQVSNTDVTAASLTFVLPFTMISTNGTAQVLTGAMTASNMPSISDFIAPKTSDITTGKTFQYTAPGFSVSVLTFTAK
jgi:alpha-N-arabinofuranosidase